MNGFINLFKTPGITSSTAVSLIKKLYKLNKVGHAGTLDPGACGVLPLMVNKATKLFDYLQDETKEYIAEFVFGTETDTLDMQGSIISQVNVDISLDSITDVIPKFLGSIKQYPPKVSAISINGKKAYELQRQNKDFEVPSREITVYDIKLIRQTAHNCFLLKIKCSKGTYIRSLCRDFAAELNTYGYVNYLLRTKSSSFGIETAFSIEELRETTLDNVIIPIDEPLHHLQKIEVDKSAVKSVIDGKIIMHPEVPDEVFRVNCNDTFLGLGRPEVHNNIQYIKVFKRFFNEEEL